MRILLFSCLRSCRLASISQLSHDYSSRLPVHNWLTSKPKPMLRYDWLSIGHRGRVTLRLAFYRQSFRLNVNPLRLTTIAVFVSFPTEPLRSSSLCIILSDENMGLSLMNMHGLSSSVRIAHITCYWIFLHYTQVLCQYRLYRADHAWLTYLMLQRQVTHLNGRKLDHRQV
jgi:hypothetical protein